MQERRDRFLDAAAQRYLAGDRALYAALAEELVRNLPRLARQRRATYADTIHLEKLKIVHRASPLTV